MAGFLLGCSTLFFALAYFPHAFGLPASELSLRFALFWAGAVSLMSSALWLVGTGRPGPRSRGLTLGFAAIESYLPKLFLSLRAPPYWDELLHLRQAQLLQSGTVFGQNTVDPTVGYFPGYQAPVVVLHFLTRLSLWQSDLAVAGLSHGLLVFAIYLFTNELSHNSRVASMAAVIYLAGPSVWFWLSEGSYETLGLPLAILTAYLCLRALRRMRAGNLLLAEGGMVATSVTHPVSALFLGGLLLLLAVIDTLTHATGIGVHARHLRRDVMWSRLLWFSGLSFAITLTWIASTGWSTIWSYILPSGQTLDDAVTALFNISHPRAFYSYAAIPGYERAIGNLELGLLPLLVGLAYLQYRKRKCGPLSPVGTLLLRACFVLSLLYFASYPLALSSSAALFVHRAWDFLWVGIAIALAYSWQAVWPPVRYLRRQRTSTCVAMALLVVLLVGNAATNDPAEYMFPLPYHFGNGVGLVTPAQLQGAKWLDRHAPGARIASDVDTDIVDWAYGRAEPVQCPIWRVTLRVAPLGETALQTAVTCRIAFVVVDKLMYKEAPSSGYIYSPLEPQARVSRPLPQSAYDTLLRTPWLELVYSNTEVAIFRVNVAVGK